MNANRRDALKLMGAGAAALALAGCDAASLPLKDTTVVDTVIVGGGFAGLTAARALQEAKQSFVVLEANDRVGGRSWTVLKDDYWIDNGAQWGDRYQQDLLTLAEELDVKRYSGVPLKGNKVIIVFNGQSHLVDMAGIENRNQHVIAKDFIQQNFADDLVEFAEARNTLDAYAKTLVYMKPYEAPNAQEWDEISFHTWVKENLQTDGARFLMNIFVNMAFAAPADEMSLLHVLHYIHSSGGFEHLDDSIEFRFEGGTQEIANRIASALGDSVHLNSAVTKIDYSSPNEVKVHTTHKVYQANNVIIEAVPAAMIQSTIAFEPALPATRAQLHQRTPLGSPIKCHLVYRNAFWEDADLNGIFVSDDHLVSFGTNNSTPDGKPILACFIEASKTREVMDRSEAEIRALVVSAIDSLFSPYIPAGVPEPEAVYIANWAAQKWAQGAYATVMAPGVWTGFQIPFGQSIDRIHFAGTETTDKTYAYLDGAIRSGKRAAQEVIG